MTRSISLPAALRTPAGAGLAFFVAALVVGVLLFAKTQIITTLTPGTTFDVHFAAQHGLRAHVSKVKIAGVPVGVVTDVDEQSDQSAKVTVKVDDEAAEQLGAEPSAKLRPTTLLGGNYYIDLVPGGEERAFAGEIPVERTQLPVELNEVSHALQPDALAGLSSSVTQLDKTLGKQGRTAIDELLAVAPGTLEPAGEVLSSLRGTQPRKDLPRVVRGLENASAVLSKQQGQLDAIVTDLRGTVDVVDARSADIARALRDMPAALAKAQDGVRRLDTTLAKVRSAAGPLRDLAEPLDDALERVDPVLVKARPFVGDLEALLADARPVVRQLVPVSENATTLLGDLDGPVMKRVNGPIKQRILTPFKGTGKYENGGSDKPLYQELAYMVTNVDRASKLTDANGAAIAFQVGAGPGSLGGLPISIEQLFRNLVSMEAPR